MARPEREPDLAAELSQLRLATLGVLHDLNNILSVLGFCTERQNDPAGREATSQAIESSGFYSLCTAVHRSSVARWTWPKS